MKQPLVIDEKKGQPETRWNSQLKSQGLRAGSCSIWEICWVNRIYRRRVNQKIGAPHSQKYLRTSYPQKLLHQYCVIYKTLDGSKQTVPVSQYEYSQYISGLVFLIAGIWVGLVQAKTDAMIHRFPIMWYGGGIQLLLFESCCLITTLFHLC